MRLFSGRWRLLAGLTLMGAILVAGALVAAQEPAGVLNLDTIDPAVPEPTAPAPAAAEEPAEPQAADPGEPVAAEPGEPAAGDSAVGEPADAGAPTEPQSPEPPVEGGPMQGTAVGERPIAPVVPGTPPVPPIVAATPIRGGESLEDELSELRDSLAAQRLVIEVRERELAALKESLIVEMRTIEAMRAEVEQRYLLADSAWRAAEVALLESERERELQGEPIGAGPLAVAAVGGAGEPAFAEDREKRVGQVVDIIKAMQPDAAARVVQSWDDGMATMALARLPARVASKVVASLPPEHAARLTAGMIKGKSPGVIQ